jgi:hypothetical protein
MISMTYPHRLINFILLSILTIATVTLLVKVHNIPKYEAELYLGVHYYTPF